MNWNLNFGEVHGNVNYGWVADVCTVEYMHEDHSFPLPKGASRSAQHRQQPGFTLKRISVHPGTQEWMGQSQNHQKV